MSGKVWLSECARTCGACRSTQRREHSTSYWNNWIARDREARTWQTHEKSRWYYRFPATGGRSPFSHTLIMAARGVRFTPAPDAVDKGENDPRCGVLDACVCAAQAGRRLVVCVMERACSISLISTIVLNLTFAPAPQLAERTRVAWLFSDSQTQFYAERGANAAPSAGAAPYARAVQRVSACAAAGGEPRCAVSNARVNRARH